jgi:hypothetical protein
MPPLVASPRLALCQPRKPRITATMPSTTPPTTEINAMIAITSAAIPRPFFGAWGGGPYPE